MDFKVKYFKIINQNSFIGVCHKIYIISNALFGDRFSHILVKIFVRLITFDFKSNYGHVNLIRNRLYAGIKYNKLHYREANSKKKPSNKKILRVGLLGCISGSLMTQKHLFKNIPSNIELYVYELKYQNFEASYLKYVNRVKNIEYFDVNDNTSDVISRQINDANLDVIYFLMYTPYEKVYYKIFDFIKTSCIIELCAGSFITWHERIYCSLFAQPQFDYELKENNFYSLEHKIKLLSQPTYELDSVLYEKRDETVYMGNEKENIIFWHGSLYKIVNIDYLDIIFSLLQEDKNLKFVFAGQDNEKGEYIVKISLLSFKYKVNKQIKYLGKIIYDIEGENWKIIKGYLNKAKLFPNSFPTGGGSAKYEAFYSGAPVVHMGFDKKNFKKSFSQVDVPALTLEETTVFTLEAYKNKCKEVIYNKEFRNKVIDKQILRANALDDSNAYWKNILNYYMRINK